MEAHRDERWYMRKTAAEALGSLGSEEEIPHLLDMVISGAVGASEAKDALMRIDRRLYCPFDWWEDGN